MSKQPHAIPAGFSREETSERVASFLNTHPNLVPAVENYRSAVAAEAAKNYSNPDDVASFYVADMLRFCIRIPRNLKGLKRADLQKAPFAEQCNNLVNTIIQETRKNPQDEALLETSVFYHSGGFTHAFDLVKIAADKGISRAQSILGCHYESGIGVEKDRSLALKYHILAHKKGDVYASVRLVHISADGTGEEKNDQDIQNRFEELRQPAYKFLKDCFTNGTHGVTQNANKEISRENISEIEKEIAGTATQEEYLKHMAKANYYRTSCMFFLCKDATSARPFLKLAAAGGHKTAQSQFLQIRKTEEKILPPLSVANSRVEDFFTRHPDLRNEFENRRAAITQLANNFFMCPTVAANSFFPELLGLTKESKLTNSTPGTATLALSSSIDLTLKPHATHLANEITKAARKNPEDPELLHAFVNCCKFKLVNLLDEANAPLLAKARESTDAAVQCNLAFYYINKEANTVAQREEHQQEYLKYVTLAANQGLAEARELAKKVEKSQAQNSSSSEQRTAAPLEPEEIDSLIFGIHEMAIDATTNSSSSSRATQLSGKKRAAENLVDRERL